MDHNYNDTPLLTSSDFEYLVEDLKPDPFTDLGSPFQIDESVKYGDPVMRPIVHSKVIPPPPPLEEYGPVSVQEEHIQTRARLQEPAQTTTPELSSSPTGIIPSRDPYPGIFGFEVHLDSRTSGKKSWLYSHALNKVFIDMGKSMMIQFRVKSFMNGLFVRALPVFVQDDFVRIPVQRCGVHAISDDPHSRAHPESEPGACYCPSNYFVRHVVHCSHNHARYDYNSESDRHSVVVPLDIPQPGSDTTTVEYQFTCKTSCPRGMNRKPIEVIFTLEDEQCEVLGRMTLPVKICSCPKRDKEKEEKEWEDRRKEEQDATQNGYFLPKPGKRRLSSAQESKQESKKIKTVERENDVKEESLDIVKKLEVIELKLTQFESRINEKMNNQESRINEKIILEARIIENRINGNINNLEARINEKINNLESRLNERMNNLESTVSKIVDSKLDQFLGTLRQLQMPPA